MCRENSGSFTSYSLTCASSHPCRHCGGEFDAGCLKRAAEPLDGAGRGVAAVLESRYGIDAEARLGGRATNVPAHESAAGTALVSGTAHLVILSPRSSEFKVTQASVQASVGPPAISSPVLQLA